MYTIFSTKLFSYNPLGASILCAVLVSAHLFVVESVFATSSTSFRIDDDDITFTSLTGTSPTFSLVGSGKIYDGAPSAHANGLLLYTEATDTLAAPPAPEIFNDSFFYNKLRVVITPGNFPPDTLYAVALSDDNWATERYISVGNRPVTQPLSHELFHTYEYWGGSDGTFIFGLDPDVTYKIRVAAISGTATQGAFSPSSAPVATKVPFIGMTIAQNVTNFSILNTNTVAQATSTDIRITTNNETGYRTYIRGTGDGTTGGLYDTATAMLIASTDSILAPNISGYGAQATSPSAIIEERYARIGNVVGKVSTTSLPLSTNTVPVENELTQVTLKVSIDGTTAAGYYTDTIYYTVTANL